ncbi:C40 family peptidase [Streptomyces caniscabiei]|uniref:C40 family peptidase n=1 Tax=Streptomyces caniscabiei TaxID=2746961 RepID=UPI0029B1B9F5|nr:bifunctional lytic transglycosylase/C40 family peptidase [Streptomyces caniscabiei]MDX3726483.1 bifunctional lytic transglycosylase/C40 family peptidase [Streptomyces caniscabiei]
MKVLKGLVLVVFVITATLIGLAAFVLVDAEADSTTTSGKGGGGLKGVPEEFRSWILKASGDCKHPELVPALLAAQLKQESGFSTRRSTVSHAGAQGPAQFMPGTWATWGRDADGNGVADPFDVGDAVMAQGRMMCSLIGQAKKSGYGGDVRSLALAGYNAGWGNVQNYRGIPPFEETQNYVKIILANMSQFQGSSVLQVSGSGSGADALRRAAGRIGTPYSWGGGTPSGPSAGFCDNSNGYLDGRCAASRTVGFDCSSLVQYAYWPSLKLPRTAAAQYGATSDRAVSRSNLKPGDLLFWSHGSSIYHVAMYAGDGNVLHAPRTGRHVEIASLANAMPERDYYGATRP